MESQQENPTRQSSGTSGTRGFGKETFALSYLCTCSKAGLGSISRAGNEQMSCQAQELFWRGAAREAPDWQVKFCLVQPSASASWKKGCARAPSAFCSCPSDLIKASPAALSLLFSFHCPCTHLHQKAGIMFQPPPTPSAHSLPQPVLAPAPCSALISDLMCQLKSILQTQKILKALGCCYCSSQWHTNPLGA